MIDRVEEVVLANLMKNEEFTRKTLYHLKSEYFDSKVERTVFEVLRDHFSKYSKLAGIDALSVELETRTDLSESEYSASLDLSKSLWNSDISEDHTWATDVTEKFCQDKAIYNAIMESIEILEGKSRKGVTKGAIPDILSNALSVTFDTKIGHNYTEDYLDRYNSYHEVHRRLKFDIDYFNAITNGGVPTKTLTVLMGGPGTGKSLVMTHMASSFLSSGYNVLYITLELSEMGVAERIDANLMNIPVEDLSKIPMKTYESKIGELTRKTLGKLVIKEYPTAGGNTNMFSALIKELKTKRGFVPDVIFVDYLNICSSSRIRARDGEASYGYIKSIAEELRGLSFEYDVPVITATQVNRSGFSSSDVDMSNTSESFGVPATADFFLALITNEELENMNQLLVKQLKNRVMGIVKHKRFVIGIDKTKMRLYNVEESAQVGLNDQDQQENYNEDSFSLPSSSSKSSKRDFSDWSL